MLCDLHLHTTKSDGVWTPERMFDEIRARDLQFFSITDHDCIDAYPVPDDLRDRCIPGLEVDSEHEGHTVHILAYGIGDPDCELLQRLRAQRENRRERMIQMVERLQRLGAPLVMSDIERQAGSTSSLGRPHLARVLVEKGFVRDVQEAFDRYLADGLIGFVALERFTAAEIIQIIHRCRGVAVVAHPLRLASPATLDELCNLGADGVEVIHPTADANARQHLWAYCQTRNIIATGGTDFHAPGTMGSVGVDFPDYVVNLLLRKTQTTAVGRSA